LVNLFKTIPTSMLLKCVVIDAELEARSLIKNCLSKIPFLKVVKVSRDPIEARDFIFDNQIDLIFVEVDIPKNLDFLTSLIKRPITIITTAYEKYAMKAFEFGVLDYLLKPIKFEKFSCAVTRAIELYRFREMVKNTHVDYLFVRSGYKTLKVDLDDIEYIEGFADYVRIHLIKEKPILSLISLKSIIEKIPVEKFKRIHRSYIVSIPQIKLLQNKKVILYSLKELPISDSYINFKKELDLHFH
jgi:two-component system, LytTR family, response regulator